MSHDAEPSSDITGGIARRRRCILKPTVKGQEHLEFKVSCSIREEMMWFDPRDINKRVCKRMKCEMSSCRNNVRGAVNDNAYEQLKEKRFLVFKRELDPLDAVAWDDIQDNYYLLPGIEAAQMCLDASVRKHVLRRKRRGQKRKRAGEEEDDTDHEHKRQALEKQVAALEQRVAQLEQAFVRGQNVAPIK
jgi:hypothetical protein